MKVFTGDLLKEKIASIEQLAQYKKRYCYAGLEDYIFNKVDHRVMALYGLRRTGKSTMMYQMIRQLNKYDSVCLIHCAPDDRMQDLTRVMDEVKCKYYFIDEVTNLENFINTAGVLSDSYGVFGSKIILSGTDSLGFDLAKRDQLFDRVYMLHTTYIPFREYAYLLDKGIDDYIMYGGTLTDGESDYNHDYYNDYSNSAIVRNLSHTLSHAGRDGEYGELISVFQNHDIRTFINKILELYNRTFLAETVNKNFQSHDLGSLKDLLVRRHSDIDYAVFDSETLRKEIMAELDIQEPLHSLATRKAIEEAKIWLDKLDVIYRVPGTVDRDHPEREEVIFTQPGLRFSQLAGLVKTLKESRALSGLSSGQRNDLCDLITDDIKGRMLEDIVYYQLAKDDEISGIYDVSKFKSPYGEFDIVLQNKSDDTAVAFEVKHSAVTAENQTRFLNDPVLRTFFESERKAKLIDKTVVYMGETRPDIVNGVHYVNAEDFLKNPLEMIQRFPGHSLKA